MIILMVLLLYFNIYYEYCFRDTIISISNFKICSCLKCFIKKNYYTKTSSKKISEQEVEENETIEI